MRPNGWKIAACLALLSGMSATTRGDAPATAEQSEFFEKSVRPVLVESCGKCHGPNKQASGLRLDSRASILEGGVNGPSVVPGKPDESLLVQVIRQSHEDIKMPPKGKLPDPAIQAIATWVQMGAPWPAEKVGAASAGSKEDLWAKHWAFQPVKVVAPPLVVDAGWVRNPIDAFVLGKLEKEGIRPSPEAERRTLIRRVTFDLTGLPPTVEEVEAFEKDGEPGAYERVVERLLKSPHYGERWGRHWLDVARYADTKGYVFQEERRYPYAYTFRDYVVRALNEDKPYDQFVTEQIAADKLPAGGDPKALAAMGFLTVGRRFLNNRDDIIDDRIDVVSRGLLGMTVACARCHDHKFDPIPTDDYYSLHGVFASSTEPGELPEIPSAVANDEQSADFKIQLAARQKLVDEFVKAKKGAVLEDLRSHAAGYVKAAYDLKYDGRSPKLDERAKADGLTSVRLRGFMPRWKGKLEASKTAFDPVFAPWHAFAALPEAEFSRKAPTVAKGLPNDPEGANAAVAKAFADDPPSSMADVAARYGAILAEAETRWKAASSKGDRALPEPEWEQVRQVLHGEGGPFTIPNEMLPRALAKDERNRYNALNKDVAALKASHPGSPPRAMVLNDAATPVQPHVYLRGNPGRPGKPVPRQFLKVLSGADRKPFTDGSGRLELARAIVDKGNPLTARVMVNRVWLQHFGSGLVGTPSDFGVRSDPPTNPELLDWLADDFMKEGWSLKALHRRMVTSATYRQKSDPRPELANKDPENRLYGRFNRRRLEFESMRDALLAASGTLDRAIGGRAVTIAEPPYSPRRTIYGFIDRQNLDGIYRTFDFASPDTTSPRRISTTVPQQALFLMNSPFVIEQAKRLASLPEVATGGPEERVRRLYARLFGRVSTPDEVAMGLGFVEAQERAGPSLPPPAWDHGVGTVVGEGSQGKVSGFEAMPHFTGTVWQMGPKLPDPKDHYLNWNATGGHVGPTGRDAVLRWTAPKDATVMVQGVLGHAPKAGNGVRGRLVSSRGGVLGDWVAEHGTALTRVVQVPVKAGDTLDFVVDARGDENSDSFNWAPVIREAAGAHDKWDAKADFQGPGARGLSPWEEYAQVLLLTNEFMFVD